MRFGLDNIAKKTLEEALAAKFCGFIPEGETPGMTDLNTFEYAYKLGVINTLGLFKMPKDLIPKQKVDWKVYLKRYWQLYALLLLPMIYLLIFK